MEYKEYITVNKPRELQRRVDLQPYGYPGYTIYEDGVVINNRTKKQKSVRNHAVTLNIKNEKDNWVQKQVSVRKLIGHLFHSPMKTLPPSEWCSLEPMGYPDYILLKDGRVWSSLQGKYLTPARGKDGYLYVVLKGTPTHQKVHRLLALAFIPNLRPGVWVEVNHIDRDRNNNNLDNLEWCTRTENQNHAHWTDTWKYPSEKVYTAMCLITKGLKTREIATTVDLPNRVVAEIRSGRFTNQIKYYQEVCKSPTNGIRANC